MKRTFRIALLLLLTLLAGNSTPAQTYLITFAGTGAATTVDSVRVENLTQCIVVDMAGSDTLVLNGGTVGLNESKEREVVKMHIYPNPTNGDCYINIDIPKTGETKIMLYDINGKNILHNSELLTQGQYAFELKGLNTGVYILQINTNGHVYTEKIISCKRSKSITDLKRLRTVDDEYTKYFGSDGGSTMRQKGHKIMVNMPYTPGDILKFTGKAGTYRTVFILIPTHSQTLTFNFVDCTDVDSNHYAVVQIGTQIWMAENLKTTKYRDGTIIPKVTDSASWTNQTTGAMCYYNNDSVAYAETYGSLYNWYAVTDSHNIAPAGWHAASDTDWIILTTYLGGDSVAAGKLKEACSVLWNSPNTGATNESGFTALPGGYRLYVYTFGMIEMNGFWWTATSLNGSFAWFRGMLSTSAGVHRCTDYKADGFSLRCVLD
jgi:uncharacterized protein (TIGR02145 family)